MTHSRSSFISIVSGLAPWLAPAIPAYFAIDNAQRYLLTGGNLDSYFVWIVGLAVEFVGLAAVHTTLEFWQWNNENEQKAPVYLAAIAAFFYVITVLTVNALLELQTGVNVRVFAKAMLSTLTLPAALIIGLRAMHTQRIERQANAEQKAENERKEANERRRAERQAERERQANEHRTPNDEQPNERTPKNRRPERTNNRTNVPQPQMNEQGTNEQGEQAQPFGFPTNASKSEQITQYIERIEAEEHRTPGQSEIARNVGVSKSTADAVLKKIR